MVLGELVMGVDKGHHEALECSGLSSDAIKSLCTACESLLVRSRTGRGIADDARWRAVSECESDPMA